ncbi:MAG TPA: hypothetical protein VGC25_04470 [Alphaproteobacteria bacterium]|jgi:hypothetical protein
MGMFPRPPVLSAVLFLVIAGAPAAGAAPRPPDGKPLAHPLFDANHCLEGIARRPVRGTVEFRWGCGEARMVTMSCVNDRAGYHGLGPGFARPGWHCNHPLPVMAQGGARASDVAVGDVAGEAVWAACFVAEYGDFAAREKPYHATPCWRALRAIGEAVNRDGLSPVEAARGLAP